MYTGMIVSLKLIVDSSEFYWKWTVFTPLLKTIWGLQPVRASSDKSKIY